MPNYWLLCCVDYLTFWQPCLQPCRHVHHPHDAFKMYLVSPAMANPKLCTLLPLTFVSFVVTAHDVKVSLCGTWYLPYHVHPSAHWLYACQIAAWGVQKISYSLLVQKSSSKTNTEEKKGKKAEHHRLVLQSPMTSRLLQKSKRSGFSMREFGKSAKVASIISLPDTSHLSFTLKVHRSKSCLALCSV